MARPRFRTLAAALVVATAACASRPSVQVNTTVAPEATFASYRTFTVLTPRMSQGGNPAASDDPMIENSIVNRALRDDISRGLTARGYAPGGPDADLAVAYYTAARQALDVSTVDYGYPYRPWWWGDRSEQEVRQINQGTVVIDVIDRRTNRLVWRGTGRTEVSTDQSKYTSALEGAVGDVLKKLPKASS